MHRAESILATIKANYPEHGLTLTGYSLGAVRVELQGITHGIRTVSFDSPGIKALVMKYAGSESPWGKQTYGKYN